MRHIRGEGEGGCSEHELPLLFGLVLNSTGHRPTAHPLIRPYPRSPQRRCPSGPVGRNLSFLPPTFLTGPRPFVVLFGKKEVCYTYPRLLGSLIFLLKTSNLDILQYELLKPSSNYLPTLVWNVLTCKNVPAQKLGYTIKLLTSRTC